MLMQVCCPGFFLCRPGCSHDTTVSVGKYPDPVPMMGSTGVASAHNSPSRVIPQSGKVSNDSKSAPKSKVWRVFHEDEAGSSFANDSGHLFPESASRTFEARLGPRRADVLAREAASDDIHHSTPRLAVEGSDIVPHGEGFEASIVLSGHEDTAGVVIDFDGAYRSESA
jgi:hypothetical protein